MNSKQKQKQTTNEQQHCQKQIHAQQQSKLMNKNITN